VQWGIDWYPRGMTAPMSVRPLPSEERTPLTIERRSANAFRVRRAHMVLARAGGQSPSPIAQRVGCSVHTVRNVIQALNTTGQDCLIKQANRPKTAQPTLDAPKRERLQHILPQSPRPFGKPTGLWTLALAAPVCWEQGVSQRCLRDETMRRALKRLGTTWKRAKHWMTSPDPHSARKKSGVLGSSGWLAPTPHGCWAWSLRSGGAAWPNRVCTPGPIRRLYACSHTSRTSRTWSPKPGRAMACCGQRHRPCCCALSMVAQSVASRPSSWAG
jgi:transposase